LFYGNWFQKPIKPETMKSSKLPFLLCCLLLLPIHLAFSQVQLYVCDAGNFNNPPWQILKFDANGNNGEVFIDENLAWPQDIVFFPSQEVVIISNLNTGTITRYNALTGAYLNDFATGIGGPTRMKIGADGLLYVLQWTGNGNVLRYELDGTFVDEFTSVGVTQSIGLDWDSVGNLYVSSYGDGTVRKFDSSGNDLGLYVDTELSGPTNIYFDENDNLFVLDWNAGNVEQFDAAGTYVGTFIDGLSQPEGIDFLPNGDILIGNGGNGSVKRFDSSGNFIEDLVAPGAAGLLQPNAVVLQDPTLGVTEQEKATFFVTPSIGTEFHISEHAARLFETIGIYDTNGKLITTISPEMTSTWDASHLSEGIYFLKAENTTQRVIVKKN
jgi:WD40 repeat protein